GHLVREIDALGGEMGRNTDRAAIQFKTLNASRGPAVRASRAQCDRARYRGAMKRTVESEPNLEVRQGQAVRFVLDRGRVAGLEEQRGDAEPWPFHWASTRLELPQIACHVTYTTPRTHEIVRENLDRSPLYSGVIDATGVRYCPSIEDKVKRFADRERHQVILEPDGLDTEEVYANGISTSLPPDAQEALVHSIPGLERAEIMRPGYAIEYDFVHPTQLAPTL